MEEFRLRYPLTAHSVVLDAGAFRGDFTAWVRQRWNCHVIGFEPVSDFYRSLQHRFEADRGVEMYAYGLGAQARTCPISIRADSSSTCIAEGPTEAVRIEDVTDVFERLNITCVDLFKINIEGGEYELLPRLLDTGLVARVRFFQIQYHSVGAPDPATARDRIRDRLRATHSEEWCVNGGQWESWARRGSAVDVPVLV